MIRRPPRSTPFPTRRSSDLMPENDIFKALADPTRRSIFEKLAAGSMHASALRSEEHTSELQSQSNLVCRLLLEKKNTNSNCTGPYSAGTASRIACVFGFPSA